MPFTVPGDRLRAKLLEKRGDGIAAEASDWSHREPRRAPVCDHFGTCGGCTVQHLPEEMYARWKVSLLSDALARQGLSPEIRPLVRVPDHARRRVTLSAVGRPGSAKDGDGCAFGFNARRSRDIVNIDTCPLLVAPLERLIAPLRVLAARLLRPRERAQVHLTWLESAQEDARKDDGTADLVFRRDREVDLDERLALTDFANQHDLARISWQAGDDLPELVVQRRPALAGLGPLSVDLPPGGFLQPSRAGEEALRRLVLEGVSRDAGGAPEKSLKLAELFCGIGTFTGVLAALAEAKGVVLAVEGDHAAADALAKAAGAGGLGGRIRAEARDLTRQPLGVKELKKIDCVVLDPPRAGAREQAEVLAEAKSVKKVVMVSCNPATFARDARTLVEGGFDLPMVTPVDQFVYSHHLECVGVFYR